jgi:hypothetical protein
MDGVRIARAKFTIISALVAGALAGLTTVVLVGTAVAQRAAPEVPEPLLEATHLPPLLMSSTEPAELRYDVYCTGADDSSPDAGCAATGSVFVRPGETGPFTEIAATEAKAGPEGRFAAVVPAAIARSPLGFTYYASFRSTESGMTTTLPAGGAAAPQQSMPLGRTVPVTLGTHDFGTPRTATRRVAEVRWGSGPGEVGLEQGRNLTPIGGSSFDVAPDGTVHVLDEANKRILRWPDAARTPTAVPVAINGTLADVAVAEDGTTHVLETTRGSAQAPLLRTFAADGAALGAVQVAERPSQVRLGPKGPVVLQDPSGQWMSVGEGRQPLGPTAQKASGRAGQPLRGGGEVVVLRTGNEIRAALVRPGGIRQTWWVTSSTPLAEVQLAEPIGSRLVLVARVYTAKQDEFVVLVLGPNGVQQRFSRDSADWAETAPLSRFRLVGSSLYQLGSTPAGVFVDRIDLEVN